MMFKVCGIIEIWKIVFFRDWSDKAWNIWILHLKKISVFDKKYSYGSFSKNRRVIHRVATSDNKCYIEWQGKTTSDSNWYNEWDKHWQQGQRMKTNDNDWKRVVQRMLQRLTLGDPFWIKSWSTLFALKVKNTLYKHYVLEIKIVFQILTCCESCYLGSMSKINRAST